MELINKEELSERPEVIVLNKIDLETEKNKIDNVINLLENNIR